MSLRSVVRAALDRLPYETARRVAIAVFGATLFAVGLILLVTPGPGIVVLTLGLTVLAAEFTWARRWLRRLERTAMSAIGRSSDADPDTLYDDQHEPRELEEPEMARTPDPQTHRQPDHDVLPMFPRRWSPRAMSGEALEEEQIMRLFEAARWAPSTFNEQEWRFLHARRDGPHWDTFFALLVDANKAWCKNGALLGCVVSHNVFSHNGKPNRVNVFDSGLAYMSLALQGSEMGLVVHGLLGFDADRARTDLKVPDDYNVNAMFVVGHPGDPDVLPEGYREREKPSGRKPVAEIACEGPFDF